MTGKHQEPVGVGVGRGAADGDRDLPVPASGRVRGCRDADLPDARPTFALGAGAVAPANRAGHGSSIAAEFRVFRDRFRDQGPSDPRASAHPHALTCEDVGAPVGIRTPNLLIRSQMLYPLSYGRPSPAGLARPDDWSRIAEPSEVAEISGRATMGACGVVVRRSSRSLVAVLAAGVRGACDFGTPTESSRRRTRRLSPMTRWRRPAGAHRGLEVELATAVAVFGLGCRPQSPRQRCSADGEKTYTMRGSLRPATVTAAWMQLDTGGGRWVVQVRLDADDRVAAARTARRAGPWRPGRGPRHPHRRRAACRVAQRRQG